MHLRIGCSGWQYRHWRGVFYPQTLPASRWLEHYAATFDTVEVNNTFYRLPEAETFDAWRRGTPPGFCIAVKASRFLTHMKKLTEASEPIARLFSRAAALGPKLGPVLYQLPSHLRLDLPRLRGFLEQLPARLPPTEDHPEGMAVRHAIEFRDPSWYTPEVFALLDAGGVALCLHDRAGSGIANLAVGPFVYVRYHGPSGAYHGGYTDEQLDGSAIWLCEQYRAGRDVFAYFNNDIGGMAPANARRLRDQLVARLSVRA